MKKNVDKLVFESRREVEEAIRIIEEWQGTHRLSDTKADTAKMLHELLYAIYFEW